MLNVLHQRLPHILDLFLFGQRLDVVRNMRQQVPAEDAAQMAFSEAVFRALQDFAVVCCDVFFCQLDFFVIVTAIALVAVHVLVFVLRVLVLVAVFVIARATFVRMLVAVRVRVRMSMVAVRVAMRAMRMPVIRAHFCSVGSSGSKRRVSG